MTTELVLRTATPAQRRLAEAISAYPVLDPDDLEERSMLADLSAESAESVLAMPATRPLDEMTGEPFTLIAIDGFLPSQVRGHEGEPYVLLRCRDERGTEFVATTGSPYSIRRACRVAELGALPRRMVAVLLQSRGDPDRSSLWLVDAPAWQQALPGTVVEAPSRPTGAPEGDYGEPF